MYRLILASLILAVLQSCSSVIKATATESKKNVALSSPNAPLLLDKEWMPGCLQPKVRHGNFLIYGVKATIEDSKKECECQNAKLVTIESKAKLYEVQDALLGNDSKHFYGIDDKFWTGGSIDLSSGHPYVIQWHGSPTIPFSDYEFQRFVSFLADHFDTAIANLNKTISKDLLGDGGSKDYIYYLGLYHPSKYPVENTGHISMLLNILNYGEILNKATSKFFVVCEKN